MMHFNSIECPDKYLLKYSTTWVESRCENSEFNPIQIKDIYDNLYVIGHIIVAKYMVSNKSHNLCVHFEYNTEIEIHPENVTLGLWNAGFTFIIEDIKIDTSNDTIQIV